MNFIKPLAKSAVLERHTLCYLEQEAKADSLLTVFESELLFYWLKQQFPLIYTTQPQMLHSGQVKLAFPFFDFETKQKIRLSAYFEKSRIKKIGPLPTLQQVFSLIKRTYPGIRVYGSYAWQYLTRQSYVQRSSDLDLLITYQGQSLQVLTDLYQELSAFLSISKLDGEVRFPTLGDCSWLELIQQKDSATILFKSAGEVVLLSRESLYAHVPTLLG